MRFTRNFRVAIALASALTAMVAMVNNAAAADQMIGFGKETFQVNFGYYYPNFSTSVAAGLPGTSVPPGDISGEDDLGLSKHVGAGRLDGFWRFADRHRLLFGYYELNRSTTTTLNKNIGPVSLPSLGVNDTVLAGSNISADSKMQVYILGYGYSFYKTNTVEIAGNIGLNVAELGTKLNGTLITQNNGTRTGSTAGNDVTLPLPVIGLAGDWAMNERWRLKGRLGGFRADFNGIKVTVTDASLGTEYRMFRNVGVGAAYSLLRMTGDVNKDNFYGSLDWRTGGFQLYGSLLF